MTTIKNVEQTVTITISLPTALAHTIERQAKRSGTTVADLAVTMLWEAWSERARKDLEQIQEYGKSRAEALGIYTEEDLFRYLES